MDAVSNWATMSKAAILSPGDFYEDLRPRDGFGPPLGHALISSLIPGLLIGVVALLLNLNAPTEAVGGFLLLTAFLGGATFVTFVGDSLAVHALVYLLGGRGLSRTVDALSYPTALYLVLWIPIVNLFVGLYVLYLQAKGIGRLHDFSVERGLVAAFFGGLLGWVTTILLLVVLLAPITGLFGLAGSL